MHPRPSLMCVWQYREIIEDLVGKETTQNQVLQSSDGNSSSRHRATTKTEKHKKKRQKRKRKHKGSASSLLSFELCESAVATDHGHKSTGYGMRRSSTAHPQNNPETKTTQKLKPKRSKRCVDLMFGKFPHHFIIHQCVVGINNIPICYSYFNK